MSENIYSGKRDAWLWPFDRNSIWNTPIGSNAVYEKAGLDSEAAMCVDREILYKTDENDDYLEICCTKSASRWPAEDELIHTGTYMYWPKGLIVPATDGNACCAILQPDGRTIIQIQPTCRATYDSKYIVGWSRQPIDIYGDGILGTHWGSGLSTLGGSIRRGELVGDEPIRHAIKLNIFAKYYAYYDDEIRGFRWPADRCDSYASQDRYSDNYYGGINRQCTMGSLLALHPDATPESLELKTEIGKKLFYPLQNYGAYVTDDSAWETHDLCVEYGVVEECERKYGIRMHGFAHDLETDAQWDYYHDLQSLCRALYVVTNNAPDNIGGGGTPRVPLAPDFE